MGLVIEDECVGCPPHMGCAGDSCTKRNARHYYCDKCEGEFDPKELYYDEDEDVMLCEECLLLKFKTVAQMEE